MAEILQIVLKVSIILFMVGSLFDMGLQVELQEALKGLRNIRFVALTLLWGFVLCPALGYGLISFIPMDPSYGVGLLLLAMAPCAPYLPLVVEKSRADMGYAATLMLLTAVGTVVCMPVAVPLLVEGLTASAWTIAKPLLFFILVPLAAGMAVHIASRPFSAKLHPFVKTTTSIATPVLLVVMFIIYGKDFISAIGSYTILMQVLFLSISAIGAWFLGFGLAPNQKSVVVLGLVSRNIGPAVAPLFAATLIDQRAVISVLLGLPVSVLFAFAVAIWFGRRV